ncbi:MAG: hypothetical protein M9949_11555 [Candidatus Kapabacteria bacterium]|nr:hypothetical protein [Candidatus Kapabacteria bacterium]
MMKYFSIFILTAAILLASCSKKSSNPTDGSNIDNGTGNNAAVVNSDKEKFTFKLGMGIFDTHYGVTDLAFTSFVPSDNQTAAGYAMSISFKGNGVASYNLDDDDNGIIIMKNYIVYHAVPGSGKINITKYGAVGQTIEGNFTAQFVSITGGETFTVTSASFKATRVEDEEDDGDPDDELSNSFMELKMTMITGESLNFSDDKLDGAAEYLVEGGLLAVGVFLYDDSDESFNLGISIYAENIENKSNQTLVFEGESQTSLIFMYKGMPYKFIGTAVISNFAQNVGDMFEISGSGEFYNLIDGGKAGDIQSFKIRTARLN